ncbi:PTS transporter subunit EIIB [Selenomonas sp. oral taxon 149]|uniref:PTS transporter subunit EIIB n=1 Tax=Selenomonas sp. oral taxon 149 TaxID=712535 RepID=UPI0001E0C5DB|nr:PTS transporter subunit EIIB [Selenomonas sp. oral taxon 149]EFM22645.1 phosphotransferase system, EIIB [Selenomonas sp. oral taxon 149 str. 67H29BP]
MRENLTAEILAAVGGPENVVSLVHCATRLRFSLKDEAKADDAKAQAIPEVLSLVKKGGQYQLVIGNDVDRVYAALIAAAPALQQEKAPQAETKAVEEKTLINRILGTITGSIAPVCAAPCRLWYGQGAAARSSDDRLAR